MSEPQTIRFGKYLLLEKVATGGMAQLFKAKITGIEGFEKLIAIKMILPHFSKEKDLVASFIDEAKLAALLNHQNIIQIYDFGNIEDSYFISMEYLLGKDLRALWGRLKDKNVALPLEHALYIVSRVCAGLSYAHELADFQGKPLNIVHRDISPANIFVTYQGDVKILDFGIAKAASQSTVTQFGMIKGKVAYMSPEQAAGMPMDQRSDIFSAGIVLYELVTNTRMFSGESTMQILTRVRDARFDSPETLIGGLHSRVYDIINRALAKEPDQRYQTATDMLADLEECMIELGLRPSSRGLGRYMRELFAEESEIQQAMEPDTGSSVKTPEKETDEKSLQTATPPPTDTATKARAAEAAQVVENESHGDKGSEIQVVAAEMEGRKKPWPLYGAVVVILVAVGAVAFYIRPPSKPTPPRAATVSSENSPGAPQRATANPPVSTSGGETSEKKEDGKGRGKSLLDQASKLSDTDPERAKSLLLEAIGLDQGSIQAHFQLGLVYVRLKEYPKAIEIYRKVAAIDPQFPDIYFNLGFAYAMNRDYGNAEQMYDRVVKLSPKYLDEALFNLAVVQDKQGKKKESIANLEKAIAVNPGNAMVKNYLNRMKK